MIQVSGFVGAVFNGDGTDAITGKVADGNRSHRREPRNTQHFDRLSANGIIQINKYRSW